MMYEHAQHWWVVDDDGQGRLEHNPSCPYLAYHEGMFDPQPTVRGYVCDVSKAIAGGLLKPARRLEAGRWPIRRYSDGRYSVDALKPHLLRRVLRPIS